MESLKEMRSDVDFSSDFLPVEIITDILSRLPVKALGRFTTVCKNWYSLIKSQMFINEHLKNYSISLANKPYSSSCESPFSHVLLIPTVIKELERHSYSLFCDRTFNKCGNFDIPMLYHWLEILYIGNSCNGIICLTDQKAFFGRKVFLFNPFIRRMKLISHNCFADTMFGREKVFCKLGFGFCECTNDFKVVRFHYVKDKESRLLGNVAPEVEIYSLNADNWRRIKVNVKCIVDYRSVSCNGFIYWLARRNNEWIFDAIMCFDIARELFSEIELPDKCSYFKDGTLLIFKGLLAIFKKGIRTRGEEEIECYELWVLTDYKFAKSWTKLSILKTHETVVKAFGFTKSGKLVMQMHGDMLASWDPERNYLKHLEIDGFLHHVDAAFVESLILYEGGRVALAETRFLRRGMQLANKGKSTLVEEDFPVYRPVTRSFSRAHNNMQLRSFASCNGHLLSWHIRRGLKSFRRQRVGTMAYRLKLPVGSSIYPIFRVSLLKRSDSAKEQLYALPYHDWMMKVR